MIADTNDLEQIASQAEADVPALKGWRLEMFGQDALRLKRGEIALAVEGSSVVCVPVDRSTKA
jgi:ribonuclease D